MDKNEAHDSSLKRKKLLVRDHLAEHRTDFANRRTFLSYFRTALSFVGGGLALIKFSTDPVFVMVGILLLPSGALVLLQGVLVCRKVKKIIREEERSRILRSNEADFFG